MVRGGRPGGRPPPSFPWRIRPAGAAPASPRGLTHAKKLYAPEEWVQRITAGPDHLYAGSYPRDSLAWWADRIREWNAQGREAYVYFNNDGDGNAVRDADSLQQLLG